MIPLKSILSTLFPLDAESAIGAGGKFGLDVILYPDDNSEYVRAVQVEAKFGPDDQECTEVWIEGG